ncbi:MAG: hypothetical protein QF735_01550, partial [Phycisphaeraceae bacterium]|nr:hypothetical protein [Phycisphaeraceae bacterium]
MSGWLMIWKKRTGPAPTDGSVGVRDVTDDYACIGLWGPDARDVLGQATDDDISNDTFPYL